MLHVVADFVGDHVGLSEVTRRPETHAEFVEEVKVNVDVCVGTAVEGAPRRRSRAASGLDGLCEEHESCAVIRGARRGERVGPVVLNVIEDERDEFFFLIRVPGKGLAVRRSRSNRSTAHPLEYLADVETARACSFAAGERAAPEYHHEDENYDSSQAARRTGLPAGKRTSGPTARSRRSAGLTTNVDYVPTTGTTADFQKTYLSLDRQTPE